MSFFKTGGNVCDFLFSSLYEEAIPKCCILFKEKICSLSKYLPLTPLRRDIYEKEQVGGGGGRGGGAMNMTELLPMKVYQYTSNLLIGQSACLHQAGRNIFYSCFLIIYFFLYIIIFKNISSYNLQQIYEHKQHLKQPLLAPATAKHFSYL